MQKSGTGEVVRSCRRQRWIVSALLVVATHGTDAAEPPSITESDGVPSVLTVTATRIPEPIDRIPATLSVVSGEELRARDAEDMATAETVAGCRVFPSSGA